MVCYFAHFEQSLKGLRSLCILACLFGISKGGFRFRIWEGGSFLVVIDINFSNFLVNTRSSSPRDRVERWERCSRNR